MSLIEFQDYPSTETPLNAENLNHNFNELKIKLLWENENKNSKFGANEVALNSSEWDMFFVVFKDPYDAGGQYLSTGFLPYQTTNEYKLFSGAHTRYFTMNNKTSINFKDVADTAGGLYVVPHYIFGINTGLINK